MRSITEIEDDLFRIVNTSNSEEVDRLFTELGQINDPLARALDERYRGLIASNRGEYRTALVHYQAAYATYRTIGDHKKIGTCLLDLAIAHKGLGDLAQHQTLLEQALETFHQVGHTAGVRKVRMSLATALDESGDHAGAVALYHECLAEAEPDDDYMRARILHNLACAHVDLADLPRAMEYAHKAIDVYDVGDDAKGRVDVTLLVAGIHIDLGDYPQAMEYVQRALDTATQTDYTVGQAHALHSKARVLNSMHDTADAERTLRMALDVLSDQGSVLTRNAILRDLGITLGTLDREDEALEIFQRLASWYRERENTIWYNDAIYRGTLALLHGERTAEARAMFDQAGPRNETQVWTRAVGLYCEAKLLIAEGRLDAAHEIGLRVLDLVLQHQIRDMLENAYSILMSIAEQRKDFDDYVKYSAEARSTADQIRGRESASRLALQAKERELQEEREQQARQRALLYGTLPPSIADRKLRGEDVSGDHFEQASVLFMDIVGFTAISDRIPPGHVVHLLKAIFRVCDDVCRVHGLTKIKTIGDSYLAVAGVPEPLADHAQRAAQAAIDLLARLSALELTMDPALGDTSWTSTVGEIRIRIGLHCGPLVAGIVGDERLQYDIWGDTVNVASRMESTGEPGRIQCSEAFAQLLLAVAVAEKDGTANSNSQQQQKLTERGEVSVKGKGSMTTYWLE